MAYGNWGAYVYKNGERQPSREDNTPYKEDELQPGYHQAFGRSEAGYSPVHASLGNGAFRLIGYRSYPQILYDGKEVDFKQFAVDDNKDSEDWSWYHSAGLKGELHGYKFTATVSEDPEAINLELEEPDGTKWTGRSGYCIGRGHDD